MNQNKQKAEQTNRFGRYFLYAVLITYIALFILKPEPTKEAIQTSMHMFIQVIPIFLLVVFFMSIINQLVNRKQIKNLLGENAGIKGWLLVAVAGILSHGPIYAWYPLLNDLQKRGMRKSFVSLFLYNRAVKIPMLPMMVYYFGINYVLVFTFWMLIASIVQAKITDWLEPYL